jgi:hypothetical protein
MALCVMLFDNVAAAQTYSSGGTASGRSTRAWQGFGQDAKERIRTGCADVMRDARAAKDSKLEWMCRLSSVRHEEADLGPWKKFVTALVKIFNQLRRLIYVGAVFMLLWIFVKGMYEGEAKWMHLGMLVVGCTMVAFAETFVDLAINRISLDDVKNGDIYVDCRSPDEGLYVCAADVEGAEDHDMRYIYQVKSGGETTSGRGLY